MYAIGRDMMTLPVFELDKDGNVVWSLNDNERFGMISDIDIMK